MNRKPVTHIDLGTSCASGIRGECGAHLEGTVPLSLFLTLSAYITKDHSSLLSQSDSEADTVHSCAFYRPALTFLTE